MKKSKAKKKITILLPAEVGDGPGDVPQERGGSLGSHEAITKQQHSAFYVPAGLVFLKIRKNTPLTLVYVPAG